MGNEYRLPIRVNANDPLCSASAIGTTVVGILFEKTGAEIRGAITVRIGLIQTKIASYQSVYEKIDAFLEEKRKSLKELDEFLDVRRHEREAATRPFRRQIEELQNKHRDVAFDFDKTTEKDLSKKAVVFDKGFDEFKPSFLELDEFLKQEREIVGTGYSGISGYSGQPGVTGVTGVTGDAANGLYYTSQGSSISTTHEDDISDEEEKALAKVEHLRSLVQSYANKLEQLKLAIKQLQEEARRLTLISLNVDAERSYKLDMNKLSAFGFEDIA